MTNKGEWEQGTSAMRLYNHDYVVDGIFRACVYPRDNLWRALVFQMGSAKGTATYHATLDEAKAVVVALVAMQ